MMLQDDISTLHIGSIYVSRDEDSVKSQGPALTEIGVEWQDLGVGWTAAAVRDLWAHRDRGSFGGGFATSVGPHVATMLRLSPS
jgi:hypothetical protein